MLNPRIASQSQLRVHTAYSRRHHSATTVLVAAKSSEESRLSRAISVMEDALVVQDARVAWKLVKERLASSVFQQQPPEQE